MSSRLSLTYIIDSGLFSNLLYCWSSATNTDAESIRVASACRELSFPWQCPVAVANLCSLWVLITHLNVIDFDLPEPSLTMNRCSSVLSLLRIMSMLVELICWISCLIHFGCRCVNISQGKTGPSWLVSWDSSIVSVES